MRALFVAVVLIALVASVPSVAAPSKGPTLATVCGASGCTKTRGERAVYPLLYEWWLRPFAERATPKPAPYYRIRLSGGGERVTYLLLYSPSRRAMRIWQSHLPPGNVPVGPYWRTVPRTAVVRIEPFLGDLRPYPARRGWRH